MSVCISPEPLVAENEVALLIFHFHQFAFSGSKVFWEFNYTACFPEDPMGILHVELYATVLQHCVNSMTQDMK